MGKMRTTTRGRGPWLPRAPWRRRRVRGVEPVPVYTISGEGAWRCVTDALADADLRLLPVESLVAGMARIAAEHGGPIDIGADGGWVRMHPDGTTAVTGRPYSIARYEQMRRRDAADQALLEALGAARDRAARASAATVAALVPGRARGERAPGDRGTERAGRHRERRWRRPRMGLPRLTIRIERQGGRGQAVPGSREREAA